MIALLVVLNSIIIVICLARPLLILATALGILLWKLRWLVAVGFIGLLAILTPVWISIYQDNQQAEQRVRDYEVTHPQSLQTTFHH